MKRENLVKKSLSPSTRYSEAFKCGVVRDYEKGILNKSQVWHWWKIKSFGLVP